MAMIVVNTFTGEIPRAEKQLLPDNAAQYAKDCDTRFWLTATVGIYVTAWLGRYAGRAVALHRRGRSVLHLAEQGSGLGEIAGHRRRLPARLLLR